MQPYLGYITILTICTIVALVTFKKVNTRYYPYLLYVTGASLVLMTTLAGPHLVGADIHLEYYYAQLHSGADVWQPLWFTPQGTSIANNVIAPLFPWPLLWTYKLVFPLAFATTPVVLYYLFLKWLTPTRSFIAAFVFMSFTPFFLEIPTIARQMVAETFLVLTLYLTLRSTWRYRYILLLLLGTLLPLTHYSVAIITLLLFGLGLLISLMLKQPFRKAIIVVLLGIIVTSVIYFPTAEDGAIARKLGHLYNAYAPTSLRITSPQFELANLPPNIPPSDPNEGQRLVPGIEVTEETRNVVSASTQLPILERAGTLVHVALGGDFLQASVIGKMFRISLWLILGTLIWGLWKLRKNKSYWVLASGAFLISALCIVPGWANILNATRFFHLSLLTLAVAVATSLPPKYLLIGLIPYFLLTSGFIFEITQQPNTSSITVPYSIGLSDHRLDLGATITSNDLRVRDYIAKEELFPLHADLHGAHLIQHLTGPTGPRNDLYLSLPKTPRPLEGYIFVRSRNTWDGTFTVWKDIGQTSTYPLKDFYAGPNADVVFQSGDAKVIKIRPGTK